MLVSDLIALLSELPSDAVISCIEASPVAAPSNANVYYEAEQNMVDLIFD